MSDTGLDEGEKVTVVMGLTTFVHGEIRLSLDLAAGFEENAEAFGRQYGEALARVVDPRRMPALAAVVAAGVFALDDLLDEEEQMTEFTFGLNLFLDGVAAYLERRGCTP